MSKATSFTPNQRLGTLFSRPGGITRSEAVGRAEHRLESIREKCVASLDDKIDALAELCAPGRELARERLVARASEIFSIAAIFEVADIAHAAGSMCDLLMLGPEGESDVETFSAETASAKFMAAIHVHVDALRRLRRPERGGETIGRAEVVKGLSQVVRKFVDPERARDEDLCFARADPGPDGPDGEDEPAA